MTILGRAFRRLGVVRAILCALFGASLILPPTRELQHLCALYMVRFVPHGRHTEIWQQVRPGGSLLLLTLPKVEFTRAFIHSIPTEADRSADGLILALAISWHRPPSETPPLESLSEHPLLSWMALGFASSTVMDLECWREDRAPKPDGERALELVRLAQRSAPHNRALWLAEAALQLDAGREREAFEALSFATAKPDWDEQQQATFFHKRRLYESYGLPAFDASSKAARGDGFIHGLLSTMRDRVAAKMAEAVRARDDERFSQLLVALVDLRATCLWNHEPQVLDAMLDRLKSEAPGEWLNVSLEKMPLEEQEAMARDHLAAHVGREALSGLEERMAAHAMPGHERAKAMASHDKAIVARELVSGLGGMVTICLLPFVVVAFVMNLPFRFLKPQPPGANWLPRSAPFWAAAAGVVALGIALLTSAWEAAVPPGYDEERIGPVWDHLILASWLCVGWLLALLSDCRTKPRPRLLSRPLVVAGLLYLAAVAVTCFFRAEYVKAVTAPFLQRLPP